MKVSTNDPFQLIYSVFTHEYLGFLFESFVIQLDAKGKLTFKHQNISSKNASEFASGMDETDFKLIELMDSIQQDAVAPKFDKKHLKPADFFLKVFNPEKGDKLIQEAISDYVDRKKAEILPLLIGKEVYIMGNDGEPAWKRIEVPASKATVLFHFRRNEDNTHYFPTIKHEGQKLDFQYNGSQIIGVNPAWMIVNDEKLISFEKNVDGNKLKPFLNKKFIVIPKKVEETYYNNFVTQLVTNYDVYAEGFTINSERYKPYPVLSFKELGVAATASLFDNQKNNYDPEDDKLVFDFSFQYGTYNFKASNLNETTVRMEKIDDNYIFHKVKRDIDWERAQIKNLRDKGLEIKHGKAVMSKIKAFTWIKQYRDELEANDYRITQLSGDGKIYFLGESSINIEVKENNDWFDIYAIVKFGEYEIPFIQLKDLIIKKKREFELPNGQIAVIPEEWLTQYSDLFSFSEDIEHGIKIKKHHLALIHELETDNLAKVTMDRKLQKLKDFETIEDYPMPTGFRGTLRPYQKAGYNWLQFLNSYNFGGCLADDMGLGKTVQTLALLLDQKEKGITYPSLLVMPTSLVYNWEVEAKKFTPDLRVLVYTGTFRDKDISRFSAYDIILTSYGIVRLDIDLLSDYYFNYIILDESQAIKNPGSNIAVAVKSLKSKHKIILTGTPIENSTMDLWSQMSFVNPGLLGSQSFFKNQYLNAIEKKNDEDRTKKLYTVIKPFIIRRHKKQVLTELPDKIEQTWYSEMSAEQEKEYEEVKSFYRNKILKEIDENGVNKSQILILQGLTKLRQIANHPRLVNEEYTGNSGKLDDVMEMMINSIEKDHKILIFSQFVRHLAIFEEKLNEKGLKYAYLDGSTKNRQGQVELFQNNEEIRIFLISLKAGGLGLNLTAADYVFILDPWWNPAIESQAVDRAHRMGQKNTVHTYKFITRNTVEEKILRLQESKRKLASDLITTEDSFVKSLTKEDIQDILN